MLFFLELNDQCAVLQGQLDIGGFLVGAKRVVDVLPDPVISMCGHTFEKLGSLQIQHHTDRVRL